MNQKFHQLSIEKKERIINASLEVFSNNEYKKASTDTIAYKAGISKGLLFYYFNNKKELYLFLFDYALNLMKKELSWNEKDKINSSDFFEYIEEIGTKKMTFLNNYPYIVDFCARAYYSQNEVISQDMQMKLKKETLSLYGAFDNINYDKFKNGANPQKIIRMLTWLTDGYISEKKRFEGKINLNEIMSEYKQWLDLFKNNFYKEEYLNGYNKDK
ncbi:MAG: TetR/AcrR family transcriptional regulator [Bacilli bacterium]